jgi:hypothetical protein
MTNLTFDNLLLVCLIGALQPLLLGFAPRLRLPSVVVEIGAGVVLGPAVLHVIDVDEPVAVLSWLGLAFRSPATTPASEPASTPWGSGSSSRSSTSPPAFASIWRGC